MKQYVILALASLFAICAHAQTLGDYRSNGNVNFTTVTNWQVLTALPSTWSPATIAPASNTTLGNSNLITVRAANNITYNSNFNFASNTNFTINIVGGIVSAGSFTVGYGTGQSTVRLERSANYNANNIFQNHTFRNLLLVGTGGTRNFSFSANLTITNSLNMVSGNLSLPAFNLTDINLGINSAGNITITGNQTITRSNITANFTGTPRTFLIQGTLNMSGAPGSSISANFAGVSSVLQVANNLSLTNSSITASFPDNGSGNQGLLRFDGTVGLSSNSAINLSGTYAELRNTNNTTSLSASTINLLSDNQVFNLPGNHNLNFSNTSYVRLLSANGLLNFAGSVNINNANATNYIQLGPTSAVRKQINVNNSFAFPIGTASNFLPVTINSGNGGGNPIFTVGVFEGATTDALSGGTASYKPPIVDAVWNIRHDGNNGKNVTLNFGWQSGLEGSAFSGLANNQLGVGIYNSGTSSWAPAVAGTGNNTANTFITGTITLAGSNARNPFAIAQIGVSLPLLTRNFTAAPYNGQVKLDWTGVATHITAHFEVERNSDGKTEFIKIATVPVRIVGESNYTFVDHNPIKPESHYRIKIIDEKGKISYTRVLKVNLGGAHFALDNLYPTLATNQLNLLISSTRQKQVRLSVIDQQGRIVLSENLRVTSGSQSHPITVGRLAAGQYVLLLNTGTETITSRFIKQ